MRGPKRLLIALLAIFGLVIVGAAAWLASQPLDIFIHFRN
jgi:hypothetical protein